jgi:hypothetical protein
MDIARLNKLVWMNFRREGIRQPPIRTSLQVELPESLCSNLRIVNWIGSAVVNYSETAVRFIEGATGGESRNSFGSKDYISSFLDAVS